MSFPLDLAALVRIGWRTDARVDATPGDEGHTLARVVAQHRNGYRVHDGEREWAAQSPADIIRRGGDPLRRPAVGDWVWVDGGSTPTVRGILPRRTLLMRSAAGERFVLQPLVTNVDTAFVVQGLDNDYNPRRIERYLALIEGSGVEPVVVLTKADCTDQADARRTELQKLLGPTVPVLALNARELASAELLAPWCRPGETLVMLGSSGAGKSTLTNTLLGIERQSTASVREHDSRGRHTTTHRALIPLPGGACMIDTPGMRELKLTGEEKLEVGHFADIDLLSAGCRFRDCEHDREPGCAVRAALASGELDAARYAHYRKLVDERSAAQAMRNVGEKKRTTKVLTRALHKRLDDKYGSH